MRHTLRRADVDGDPYLVWNEFIRIIAMTDPAELTPMQRRAQLVFNYESEVQNGGHGQFFENRGIDVIMPTSEALRIFGLPVQAATLLLAREALADMTPGEDWARHLSEERIEAWDAAFYASEPNIVEALQRHLDEHRDAYVVIE